MAPESRSPAPDADEAAPDVAAAQSCPGRTVFIESDNCDGWIASDCTVDVTQ